MWVWFGFVLSLGLGLLASWRSRAKAPTYYEGEVYGMDARAHRTYAAGFLVAAGMFLAGLFWPGLLRGPFSWWPQALLALVVLTGILYGSGFLRGATGEDE